MPQIEEIMNKYLYRILTFLVFGPLITLVSMVLFNFLVHLKEELGMVGILGAIWMTLSITWMAINMYSRKNKS